MASLKFKAHCHVQIFFWFEECEPLSLSRSLASSPSKHIFCFSIHRMTAACVCVFVCLGPSIYRHESSPLWWTVKWHSRTYTHTLCCGQWESGWKTFPHRFYSLWLRLIIHGHMLTAIITQVSGGISFITLWIEREREMLAFLCLWTFDRCGLCGLWEREIFLVMKWN